MNTDEAIKEHVRLIRRIKTGENLDEEAKEQENDLKELRRMKTLEKFIAKLDDAEKEHLISMLHESMESKEEESEEHEEEEGEEKEEKEPKKHGRMSMAKGMSKKPAYLEEEK